MTAPRRVRARRFIVEGTWSGYTSSQSRVVHRTVHTGTASVKDKYLALDSIRYTDGTVLYLSVRDCKPRERVTQIHGYDSLIRKCILHGCNSVAGLPAEAR